MNAADDDERTSADDELARRRQERTDNGEGEGEGAKSLADLAGEPEVGEEADGQLFVWEQGRKVTLGTIIARGTTVEHAFVFGGKRLKGRGGLIGMEEDVVVITRGKLGAIKLVPTRDEDERVTKVVIETHIASKVVTPADSDEGETIMRSILDARALRRQQTG